MATTRYSAPRAPYTGLREGFEALMRKKDAALSGGAYARDPRPSVTSVVRAAQRSRRGRAALILGVPAAA